MIAVNWPATRSTDTSSSAWTAASPAPYCLLTPTARAAALAMPVVLAVLGR